MRDILIKKYKCSPILADSILSNVGSTANNLGLPSCLVAAFAAHESGFKPYCYSDKFYYDKVILKNSDDTKGWPARTKITFADWKCETLPKGIKPTDNIWGSYGLWQTLYETAVRNGYSKNADPMGLFVMAINAHYFECEIKKAMKRSKDLKDIISIYNSGRPFINAPKSTLESYVPSVLVKAKELNDGKDLL